MFRIFALIGIIVCQPTVTTANYVNVGGPSTDLVWHPSRGFYGGNMRPATTYVMVGTTWKQVAKTYKRTDGAWVEIKEGGADKDRWTDRFFLEGIFTLLLPGIYPARLKYRGDDFVLNTTTINTPTEDFSCLDAVVSSDGVVVDSQTKIATVTLDCLDTSGGWAGDKVFRLDVMGYIGLASFLLDGSTGTALTVSQRWSYEIYATNLSGDAYIYEFYIEIVDI